ncbi:MAG: site-specific integrase [Bacteroidetes bacterium]|nr:site-specific integrase [Bacteroidota bacterium]
MTTITIKIVLKPDYIRKDGTKNVRLRLWLNRRAHYFTLNIFVKPDDFKNGRVRKSDPDHFRKNMLLDKAENKANNILFDLQVKDIPITASNFEQHFINDSFGSKSFFEFAESELKSLKDILAPATMKSYQSQINKLKDYRSELLFNDLNHSFIQAYYGYLISDQLNNENTANKSLRVLRVILNKAINQGMVKENVFNKFRLGKTTSNRQALTRHELLNLEELYESGKLPRSKSNVLKYFLFACFTGLRYQDLRDLRFNQISENILTVVMHKTKDQVRIPLISQSLKLIDHSPSFTNQKVFKVLTGQATNRYLKDIISGAKISKEISFHCARHSFATIGIDLGIPIDVIGKILGHKNLKTTQIYTKYSDQVKVREMDKWEKL